MRLSRPPRLLLLVALALAAPHFAADAAAQQQDTARVAPVPPDTGAARAAPAAEPRRERPARPHRNRLTREEIQQGNQGNMLEVIRARRPHWIRRNSPDRSWNDPSERVAIFVDGVDQSGDHGLEDFLPTQVVRAEYVPTTDAVVLYGPRYSKGIIMLHTH